MLEKLRACESIEDMVVFGASLLRQDAVKELRSEFVKNKIVFDSGDYWREDTFNRFSLEELLSKAQKDSGDVQVLHLLQTLIQCCPATSGTLEMLLKKVTR